MDDPGLPVGLDVDSPGTVLLSVPVIGGNIHAVPAWDTTTPWRISLTFTVPLVVTDSSFAELNLEEADGTMSGIFLEVSVSPGDPASVFVNCGTSGVSVVSEQGVPHVATLTFDGTNQTMALDGVDLSTDPVSVGALVTPNIGLLILANDATGIRANAVRVEFL